MRSVTSNSLFEVLGSRLSVCCEEPRLSRDVHRLLDAFRVVFDEGAPVVREYTLSVDRRGHATLMGDGSLIFGGESWPDVVAVLLTDINRSAIEAFSGFAVHAGAVATADGAVTFPAVSGAGKSVLSAACALAGFAYVSDEALCISEGRVLPYPKPIALSPAGWALVGRHVERDRAGSGMKVMMSAEELGVTIAPPGLRLAHVVVLARYDGPPSLVASPRSEALAALLRMSFNHFKRPADSFALVSTLAAECQAWRLEYSDPMAAAEHLLDRLAG